MKDPTDAEIRSVLRATQHDVVAAARYIKEIFASVGNGQESPLKRQRTGTPPEADNWQTGSPARLSVDPVLSPTPESAFIGLAEASGAGGADLEFEAALGEQDDSVEADWRPLTAWGVPANVGDVFSGVPEGSGAEQPQSEFGEGDPGTGFGEQDDAGWLNIAYTEEPEGHGAGRSSTDESEESDSGTGSEEDEPPAAPVETAEVSTVVGLSDRPDKEKLTFRPFIHPKRPTHLRNYLTVMYGAPENTEFSSYAGFFRLTKKAKQGAFPGSLHSLETEIFNDINVSGLTDYLNSDPQYILVFIEWDGAARTQKVSFLTGDAIPFVLNFPLPALPGVKRRQKDAGNITGTWIGHLFNVANPFVRFNYDHPSIEITIGIVQRELLSALDERVKALEKNEKSNDIIFACFYAMSEYYKFRNLTGAIGKYEVAKETLQRYANMRYTLAKELYDFFVAIDRGDFAADKWKGVPSNLYQDILTPYIRVRAEPDFVGPLGNLQAWADEIVEELHVLVQEQVELQIKIAMLSETIESAGEKEEVDDDQEELRKAIERKKNLDLRIKQLLGFLRVQPTS